MSRNVFSKVAARARFGSRAAGPGASENENRTGHVTMRPALTACGIWVVRCCHFNIELHKGHVRDACKDCKSGYRWVLVRKKVQNSLEAHPTNGHRGNKISCSTQHPMRRSQTHGSRCRCWTMPGLRVQSISYVFRFRWLPGPDMCGGSEDFVIRN